MTLRAVSNATPFARNAAMRAAPTMVTMLASVADLPTARVFKSDEFPILIVVAFGLMLGAGLALAAFALGAI